MQEKIQELLKDRLTEDDYRKLTALKNQKLHRFVADAIELCNPDSVFVCTDSRKDVNFVREQAVATGDESTLAMEGHTVHFDGYHDQARDKANTKYLVPPEIQLGANLNQIEKEKGLSEVRGYLKNIMSGRRMFVRFFCLGPTNSDFSLSAVQLTDSSYVAHSEDLLYRSGYEQFKKLGDSEDFFRVLHSAGELENFVSRNVDKRRVYIDIEDDIVYSVNTQYAGNTIGFKKLCLRLAIRKADREGWLSEHMFVMGVHGPGERVTYFTGAFPSFCGKTSTAMIEKETVIGDDLAYLRRKNNGVYAVNVENGIFGIIHNVNAEDDPGIWKVLSSPGEVIFSNVLVADDTPYWEGDGREHPEKGVNHSGDWYRGKKDDDAKEIPPSHKNARYTIKLSGLDNLDERADDPEGVPVGGIIYGGRNARTWVPLKQAFDWDHGVITMGAILESETTAATLDAVGVRNFNPMSNLDFLSIPLERYIQNHLDFVKDIENPPLIFSVNYFLKDVHTGKYLNGMKDKYVWLKWMELRAHNEIDALRTPVGFIPKYEDLKRLFREVLDSDYTEEQYAEQFKIRIPENLNKIARMEEIYHTNVADTPQTLFDILAEQHGRLLEVVKKFGDYPSPFDL